MWVILRGSSDDGWDKDWVAIALAQDETDAKTIVGTLNAKTDKRFEYAYNHIVVQFNVDRIIANELIEVKAAIVWWEDYFAGVEKEGN